MGPLTFGLLLLNVAAGAPDAFHIDPETPVWPAPPDAPRVAFVGTLAAPRPGFARPLGVACDADRVVVTDPEAHAVFAFDLARDTVRRIGGRYHGMPLGVAIDGHGEILVADGATASVLVLSGRRNRRVRTLVQGPPLVRPAGIAPTERGHFIVDAGADAVFEIVGGAVVATIGGRGGPDGGFNVPVAVATRDGALYVSDALNSAVQKVVDGVPVVVASGPNYGGAGLVRPKGIALDDLGRLHVVDAAMQHVQVYAADGSWLGWYGEPGDGPGQLALPSGICIFGSRVFVADDLHRQIAIYALLDAGET